MNKLLSSVRSETFLPPINGLKHFKRGDNLYKDSVPTALSLLITFSTSSSFQPSSWPQTFNSFFLNFSKTHGQATVVKTIAPVLSIESRRHVAPSGDFKMMP